MSLFSSIRKVREGREPPGLEREILRRLPKYWLGGTVVPILVAIFNRLAPATLADAELAKRIFLVDALAAGAVITVWTAAFTVAIGCLAVVIMKGPHYVADSYPIDDADRPDPPD